MEIIGLWNYWVIIVLMMIGLYIVIARDNLIKKMMGLGIFQVSIIMFYVSMGKVRGGTAPIIPEGGRGRLFKPTTSCVNADSHCCGDRNAGARAGPCHTDLRILWHGGRR